MEFHDLPRGVPKIRDHIREKKSKDVVSDIWGTLGTRPKEALPDLGVQKMAQKISPPSFLFGVFRGAPSKSESKLVNKLSILLHRCGLRSFGCASEHFYELVGPLVLLKILLHLRVLPVPTEKKHGPNVIALPPLAGRAPRCNARRSSIDPPGSRPTRIPLAGCSPRAPLHRQWRQGAGMSAGGAARADWGGVRVGSDGS